MNDLHVVILAAGKGTRMKSALPKLVHVAHGLTLLERVVRVAQALAPASIQVVVGHQAEVVQRAVPPGNGVQFVVQEPQLGTGHALLQTEPHLRGARGTLVLMYADVPLLSADTIRALVERHRTRRAAATVITAELDEPAEYGRIIRRDGQLWAITEFRDATLDERAIREINSGIYAFDLALLFDALHSLGTGNAQREYYLTDLIELYRKRGDTVDAFVI